MLGTAVVGFWEFFLYEFLQYGFTSRKKWQVSF